MERGTDTGDFLRALARAEGATAREAWDEAAALWAAVVAANPVEGRFWTRLGEARHHAKDYRRAIAAFARALDLRDDFPAETAYRIACCHALLDAREQALAWLERAWGMGYRHVEHARTDDDLASVREDARFRELTGMLGAAGGSREEGWRGDLRFLAREVKRRAYAPFREVSEERFDAALAALADAIPDLTDVQVIAELAKLLRLLGDGHARVRPPKERADLQQAAPVQFYLFAEGLFVTAAAPRYAALLGTRVLKFGERSADEVCAALDPLIARDNENSQWVKEQLPPRLRDLPLLHALGLIPEPERATLIVQTPEGATREVVIATDPTQPAWSYREAFPAPAGWRYLPRTLATPLPRYLRNADLPYWFEHLPAERLVYCQFNSVRNAPGESLPDFSQRLFNFIEENPVEKLALDMRWNDGGNTMLELPLLHRIVGSRKINRRGALFVIIGRRTFSAAQNGVNFLDFHSEAILVGEPTGSSPTFIGETSEFALPYSKVQINVSDLRWVGTWPGDYRTWIAPTLYAPPTFAAFRANRDPALEAILAYREHLPGL